MRLLALALLLTACPAEEPEDTCPRCVEGELAIVQVPEGAQVPPLEDLHGDAWDLELSEGELLAVFADNDARAGDLMAFVFDGEGGILAGPGEAGFSAEYLNADWGCSTEPAAHPPARPRGCPDNTWISTVGGAISVVIVATDGDEATVGYRMRVTVEGSSVLLSGPGGW